jgi:hypothetical protein
MKTEIQTLFARVIPGKINPLIQSVADVPDSDLEFYWRTVAFTVNVNEARKLRMPEQRIVRKATSRYPAVVIEKLTGRHLYIFVGADSMIEARDLAVQRLRLLDKGNRAEMLRNAE